MNHASIIESLACISRIANWNYSLGIAKSLACSERSAGDLRYPSLNIIIGIWLDERPSADHSAVPLFATLFPTQTTIIMKKKSNTQDRARLIAFQRKRLSLRYCCPTQYLLLTEAYTVLFRVIDTDSIIIRKTITSGNIFSYVNSKLCYVIHYIGIFFL